MTHSDYGTPPPETPAHAPPFDDGGEPPRRGLPWERREMIGPGPAILQTIKQVMTSPSEAFRTMKTDGGWGEPLGFALLVGSVSSWIAQAWLMLLNALMVPTTGVAAEQVAAANAQEIWWALAAPFVVLFSTVIGSGIVHVLLMAFGGAPRSYETTLRVGCYSHSAGVLNLIPICGAFIGGIWRLVIYIIGVREAHPVPTGRAAAAVITPLVVACFCLMLLFFVVIGFATMAGIPV